MSRKSDSSPRSPLTPRRVLEAAVELADTEGLDALTMRRIGAALDVEAMSLYKHVANKDAILDGIVELVIEEMEIAPPEMVWKDAMTLRAHSAREVLSRHSWAIGLLGARGLNGPSARRYLNDSLGSLRAAGFTIEDAAHTLWALDSYVFGHVTQEASTSISRSDGNTDPVASESESMLPAEFPHVGDLLEHARRSAFTYDDEFDLGLGILVDGLEGLIQNPTGG